MGADLLLCGVVHDDLQGPQRLEKVLRDFKPDLISLEGSEDGFWELVANHEVNFQMTQAQFQAEHTLIVPSELQGKVNWDFYQKFALMEGFESWVALNYSMKRGARLFCIEDQASVERRIGSARNNNYDYLLTRAEQDHIALTERLYDIDYHDTTAPPELVTETLLSNRSMTDRLRKTISYCPGTRIIHIVGMAHLFGEHPTIVDLLKRYKPRVMRLNEANRLPEPRGGYLFQGTSGLTPTINPNQLINLDQTPLK